MLQFAAIKKICEHRILELLSPSICLKIWKTTELLDISPLWLKAKCMALQEFPKICDRNLALELSLEDICMYLGHIHLNVRNELSVFQTAMNWWYENQEIYEDMDFTKIILRLLNCIDFKKLEDNEIKEMQTYPDIADNSEIIAILNCIIELLENGIEVCCQYSKEQFKYAIHLCNSKSRQVPESPCILLQPYLTHSHPNKKSRCNHTADKNVVVYDCVSNECLNFLLIDGDKIRDLVGFKFLSYKEFVLFYGGGYIISGLNNWNMNFWSYDSTKERWERKSVLPEGRRHFETILVDQCIYIVGGIGKFRVVQESLLWYDFKSDKWSTTIPLPYNTRNFKCCSFKSQLCLVYLLAKRAFLFNDTLSTWTCIEIIIEEEIVNDIGDFTVFSDCSYIYAKGKHLIKFKFVNDSFVPVFRKTMRDIEYDEIDAVLCNRIVYTLYKCLDEHCNFYYSFEALNLETDTLHYIFRDKVQERDTLKVEDKLFCFSQYTKLFSFRCYYLARENIFVNDFIF